MPPHKDRRRELSDFGYSCIQEPPGGLSVFPPDHTIYLPGPARSYGRPPTEASIAGTIPKCRASRGFSCTGMRTLCLPACLRQEFAPCDLGWG